MTSHKPKHTKLSVLFQLIGDELMHKRKNQKNRTNFTFTPPPPFGLDFMRIPPLAFQNLYITTMFCGLRVLKCTVDSVNGAFKKTEVSSCSSFIMNSIIHTHTHSIKMYVYTYSHIYMQCKKLHALHSSPPATFLHYLTTPPFLKETTFWCATTTSDNIKQISDFYGF